MIDYNIVNKIVELLSKDFLGIKIFFESKVASSSQSLSESMKEGIHNSELVLLMYSIKTFDSSLLNNEVEYAESKHKRVLTILLDDNKLKEEQSFFEKTGFYIDDKDNYNHLKSILSRLTTIDYSHYIEILKKRVKKGDINAIVEIGNAYFNGIEDLPNYKRAISWFTKAVEQGNTDVQMRIGDCYFELEDFQNAIIWYEKTAGQGDTDVQMRIGDCYYHLEDFKNAIVWYRKAAEAGDTLAACTLGEWYEYGDPVDRDINSALYWYVKVSENVDFDCQYGLGHCYEELKDYDAASIWYRKAANKGEQGAIEALQRILKFSSEQVHKELETFLLGVKTEDKEHREAYKVYAGTDLSRQEELNKVIEGGIIYNDAIIRDGAITSLSPATIIYGTLGLSNCKVETLTPVKYVLGDVWCSFNIKIPHLKSLGSIKRINGDASFRYTPLEDLGDLEYVGGNLSLRDTRVNDLGKLSYVGGHLFLPKRLQGTIDLGSIIIKDGVRYWNDIQKEGLNQLVDDSILLSKSDRPIPYWPSSNFDYPYQFVGHSMKKEPKDVQEFYKYFREQFEDGVLLDVEGNTKYCFMLFADLQKRCDNLDTLSDYYKKISAAYPKKLKDACEDYLIEHYQLNNEYSKAWDIIANNQYIDFGTLLYFRNKLGDSIFNGRTAEKMCGSGWKTKFSKNNIDKILEFFPLSLSQYESKYRINFLDFYYEQAKIYFDVLPIPNSIWFFEDRRSRYAHANNQYYDLAFNEYSALRKDFTNQLQTIMTNAQYLFKESLRVTKNSTKTNTIIDPISISNIYKTDIVIKPIPSFYKKMVIQQDCPSTETKGIWYNRDLNKLNEEGSGQCLGQFEEDDRILVVLENGTWYTTTLGQQLISCKEKILRIEKFDPIKTFSAIYYTEVFMRYEIKRFSFVSSDFSPRYFILEKLKSKLIDFCDDVHPQCQIIYKDNTIKTVRIDGKFSKKHIIGFGEVLGFADKVRSVRFIEPFDDKNEHEEMRANHFDSSSLVSTSGAAVSLGFNISNDVDGSDSDDILLF